MEQILFYHIWGLQTFWSSDLNNLMNNPSNSPVISETQVFRYVYGSPNEWPWIKGHRSAWLQDFSKINALGIKFDLAIK